MLNSQEIEEIRKNPEGADWNNISRTPGLSKEFIREFADRVDWEEISWAQTLSEGLIKEFADRVDWSLIIWNQNLSQDFMLEMMFRIQPIIYEDELAEICQYSGYEVEKILEYYRLCRVC